ncbi:MAG: collagen-like protein [Deltaproteobacteria bacterium]|nr:MAG: collagen-like protein [Deltaproteobacteria bacterium]
MKTRWNGFWMVALAAALLLAAGCDEVLDDESSSTGEPGQTGQTGEPGQTGQTGEPGQTGATDESTPPVFSTATATETGEPTSDLIGSGDERVEAIIAELLDAPQVGTTLTLDGSASRNETEDDLTYSWSVRERPRGSTADMAQADEAVATFRPDRPGLYRIRLIVRAGDIDSAASLTFETLGCSEPVVISGGNITTDETWTSQDGLCPAFVVEGRVNVRGATLTVEPGTVVLFRDGAGIAVESGGALRAEGEATAPIVFRGTEEERGWWRGIYFETERPTNRLVHVTIEHAGSDAWATNSEPAGLTVARPGRSATLRLQNSTLRENSGWGMFAGRNGALDDFAGNTFTGNQRGAAYVDPRHMTAFDADSVFTGNDVDVVRVISGSLDVGGTIRSIDVPWSSEGFRVVDEDVVIEAGAVFEMRDGTGVTVDGPGLRIDGSETAPVIFRGSEPEAGWWKGVFYEQTTSSNNAVRYVVIEHAGSEAQQTNLQPAGLTLSRGGRTATVAELTGVVARNNAGYGIYIHENARVDAISELTLEGNDGAMTIDARHMRRMDAESTFLDNGDDRITVRGGSAEADGFWENPGTPWFVTGNLRVEAIIGIAAGSIFEFDNAARLRVDGCSANCRIDAVGETTNPIVFQGSQAQKGWWYGILLLETSGDPSIFEWVEVRDAGFDAAQTSVEPAGIVIGRGGRDASGNVTNSTFDNIGNSEVDAYGIYVHPNGAVNADICAANTFLDIDGPDCFLPEG